MSNTRKELKDELMDFLTHENEYVHAAAQQVLDLVVYLDTDQISEAEFNELAGDILDMDRAAKAGKDIERAAQIETGMRALIALLPKLVGMATGK